MPKKQTNIRLSERTLAQLDALTEHGSTITEVVTVAIDRMYREQRQARHLVDAPGKYETATIGEEAK